MNKRHPDEVMSEILSKNRNIEFIRWQGEYSTMANSYALMRCIVHQSEFVAKPCNMLHRNNSCHKCYTEAKSDASRRPDDECIAQFRATGKFAEGTIFTRTGRVNKRKSWKVYCPVCAADEYAQAGLCDGNFTSTSMGLVLGRLPCRCSARTKLTDAQWEFRINKELDRRNNGVSLVRITKTKTWISSILHLYCEEHGDFSAPVFNYLHGGTGCPSCAKTGFDPLKPAHLYVLKIEGNLTEFTGYGISNYIDNRMDRHRRVLAKYGFYITDHKFLPVKGEDAFKIENSISKQFPIYGQCMEGFRKEATYADRFLDVISFVEKLTDSKLPCAPC